MKHLLRFYEATNEAKVAIQDTTKTNFQIWEKYDYFYPYEPELKPCPCCGGKATLMDRPSFYVECIKCGLRTSEDSDSFTEPIEMWNRREYTTNESKVAIQDTTKTNFNTGSLIEAPS
jgi:hypothetical protein